MFEPLLVAWRERRLIWRLAEREVMERYRGSVLGMLWAVITPLVLLAIYVIVFSMIFPSRWVGAASSDRPGAFAIFVFSGMTTFNIFSDNINRAPKLVFENVSYVKKVVFPLEVLPWISLVASGFNTVIGFVLLLIGETLVFGVPPLTAFLLPLVLLPLVFQTLAFSWLLASLGVFLRDLRQLVGTMVTMLMFLSPVFYSQAALPERLAGLAKANPMFFTITSVRQVLIEGQLPDPALWLAHAAMSWVLVYGAYRWFRATRSGFADVL
jgi:lipopolysaccharide transport system permease protein